MAALGLRHGVLNAPKQKEELRIGERFWEKGTGVKLPFGEFCVWGPTEI